MGGQRLLHPDFRRRRRQRRTDPLHGTPAFLTADRKKPSARDRKDRARLPGKRFTSGLADSCLVQPASVDAGAPISRAASAIE